MPVYIAIVELLKHVTNSYLQSQATVKYYQWLSKQEAGLQMSMKHAICASLSVKRLLLSRVQEHLTHAALLCFSWNS